MKFDIKYPGMVPIHDQSPPPEFIIRGRTSEPCHMCGELTEYIEANYEAYFCSEECVKEMDDRYFAACENDVYPDSWEEDSES